MLRVAHMIARAEIVRQYRTVPAAGSNDILRLHRNSSFDLVLRPASLKPRPSKCRSMRSSKVQSRRARLPPGLVSAPVEWQNLLIRFTVIDERILSRESWGSGC
jgi:hypothetical protein